MVSAFGLILLASLAQEAVSSNNSRRGLKPKYTPDPSTTKQCTFWYDNNDGSIACQDMPTAWSIRREQWLRWNPAIRESCSNFVIGKSYCIKARQESSPAPTPTLKSAASSSSSSSTTTKPNNGVATPTPTQPGMVDNCNKFYWVSRGERCDGIASKNGISVKDFLTWNRKVGQQCENLWAETYACVSVIGYNPPPTTSKPGNGVQTPSPTQPGMVANCGKFYYVNAGDSCVSVASKAGISVADLAKWNPQVGAQCTGLWANAYACVGIIPAFSLRTRYHNDCTGAIYNDVSVTDDTCVDTGCSAASLEVAPEGFCPDGQAQISYWEKPGCTGKWFGYGYAKKGQCHPLWTEGWKFKALHFRCAKKEDDCVSNRTCTYDTEPATNLC